MGLLLVHLSDIHVRSTSSLKEPKSIVACFREIPNKIADTIVVLSGDTSFSGIADEFALATQYLKELSKEIKGETGVDPKIVIVPGNHDCHFPNDSAVRDLVLQSIRDKKGDCASDEMLRQCVGPQDEFFHWITTQQFGPALVNDDRLCWVIEHDLESIKKAAFICLNTAWLSVLHEEQGKLFFPIDKIPEVGLADLVITVFHHPYNWFESNNARALRRTLEEASDIVLTGHEHESDIYRKSIYGGPQVDYLEGDVFHSASDPQRSGFHLILIDLQQNRFQVRPYSWKETRFSLSCADPEWLPFVRNVKRANRRNEISATMRDFLRDPGANLTHSAKPLELEDIFVAPNLRRFARLNPLEGIQKEIVQSEFAINRVFKDRFAYFSGDVFCGKSSLAKMLFTHGLRRGLVPVYLTGEQINSVEPSHIQRAITSRYSKQYDHPDSGSFAQMPKEHKMIIVDDLFNTRLNGKGKGIVCEWLVQNYGYVFVFGGNLTQIEEIFMEGGDGGLSSTLIHYEIMEFGFLLREQLIQRWLSLGKENLISDEELHHQINQVERLVNTVLGKNLLPAYPIFVLVTLQQHEAGQELNTTTGAYGYFYDVLITSALRKTSGSVDDIDSKYNYLAELAWHLFTARQMEIEIEKLNRFNATHWTKYRLTGSSDRLLQELITSRILVDYRGQHSFQYKYIHYYFVARYIHNNITERSGTTRSEAGREYPSGGAG